MSRFLESSIIGALIVLAVVRYVPFFRDLYGVATPKAAGARVILAGVFGALRRCR